MGKKGVVVTVVGLFKQYLRYVQGRQEKQKTKKTGWERNGVKLLELTCYDRVLRLHMRLVVVKRIMAFDFSPLSFLAIFFIFIIFRHFSFLK